MRRQVWAFGSDPKLLAPVNFHDPCYPRPTGLISSILIEVWLPLTFTHHSEICKKSCFYTIFPNFMSLRIWATRTTTLSYTEISFFQAQTSLLAFPRFIKVANFNLTWIRHILIRYAFYYGSDKTVFLNAVMSAHSPHRLTLVSKIVMSPLQPFTKTLKYPIKFATAILRLGKFLVAWCCH